MMIYTHSFCCFMKEIVLCGRMITGILEPLLHLEASLSQSVDSFVVTKHCSFSRSSPLNLLWSAALSPALCSTGQQSKLLFSHLRTSRRLCLFSPPMFISCGKSWNVCCPSFFFLLCYYCVLCEWQQARCTEKPPDKSRLHSALRWLTDSYTHWMYCRTVFKTRRII